MICRYEDLHIMMMMVIVAYVLGESFEKGPFEIIEFVGSAT